MKQPGEHILVISVIVQAEFFHYQKLAVLYFKVVQLKMLFFPLPLEGDRV